MAQKKKKESVTSESISKVVAKWKKNARVKTDPLVALAEIERIKAGNGGVFKPKDIVAAAKAESNPLHGEFEWDDTKAAEAHRIDRARYITRSLTIVKTLPPKEKGGQQRTVEIRKYTSKSNGLGDDARNRFHDTEELLSDEEQRRLILLKIWSRLSALRREYNDYVEFSEVWKAIEKTGENLVNAV